jgi:hypothetical protein
VTARRLDTVVRIRALQERLAKGEVMARRLEQQRCEDDASRAHQLVSDRARPPAAPTSAHRFLASRSMLGAGMATADRARRAADDARCEFDAAVESWTRASQRLEGVERLDERSIEAAAAELEGLELDDHVVMTWGPS